MKYIYQKGIKFDFYIDTLKSQLLHEHMVGYGAYCVKSEFYYLYIIGWCGNVPKEGVLLSGYVNHRGRLILGPCSLDIDVYGHGDWIAVKYSQAGVKVTCDRFGTSPLFYGKFCISNSPHLIMIAQRLLGTYDANLSSLAADFLIENSFNLQSATFHTAIQGIYQLSCDSRVVIDESGVKVETISRNLESVSEEEYWSLIKKGAEEIIENVDACIRSGRVVVAALTGGRDSRLIYAAIKAGGLLDRVYFKTLDHGEDLRIAASILGRFGGRYLEKEEMDVSLSSFETVWQRVQSHNQFNYHRFDKLIRQVSYHHTFPVLLLEGSFGEIYRGFYQDIVKEISLIGVTEEGEVEKINRWLQERAKVGFARSELLIEELASTLEYLQSGDIFKTLIAHYLNFRAKFHFGNKVHLHEKVDIHALHSHSLLELARRVPSEILFSGRIVFDVTRELCEELAFLEYDTEHNANLKKYIDQEYDGRSLFFDKEDFDRGIISWGTPVPQSQFPKLSRYEKNVYEFCAANIEDLIGECYSPYFFQAEKENILGKVRWLHEKKSPGLVKYYSIFSKLKYYME